MKKKRGFQQLPFLPATEPDLGSAAALAAVLTYYGRPTAPESVQEALGISARNPSAQALLQVSEQCGLKGWRHASSPEEAFRTAQPVLLYWDRKRFVAGMAGRKARMTISDPEHGRYLIGFTEFCQHYAGSLLAFQPGETQARQGPSRPAARLGSLLHPRSSIAMPLVLSGVFSAAMYLLCGIMLRLFFQNAFISGNSGWTPGVAAMLAGFGFLVYFTDAFQTFTQSYYARVKQADRRQRMLKTVDNIPFAIRRAVPNDMLAGWLERADSAALHMDAKIASSASDLLCAVIIWAFLFACSQLLAALFSVGMAVLMAVTYVRCCGSDCGQSVLAGQAEIYMCSQTWQAARSKDINMLINAALSRQVYAARCDQRDAQRSFNAALAALYIAFGVLMLHITLLCLWKGWVNIGAALSFWYLAVIVAVGLARLPGVWDAWRQYAQEAIHTDSLLGTEAPGKAEEIPSSAGAQWQEAGYRAAPDQPLILERVSCRIPAGQVTAIISDHPQILAELCAGRRLPTQGSIYFGDWNAAQLPAQRIRQWARLVQPEQRLYGSILAVMGRGEIPEQVCTTLAREIGLHEMVMKLHGKYQYEMDGGEPDGVRMLVGAAAALLAQPGLVVLDRVHTLLDEKHASLLLHAIRRRGVTAAVCTERNEMPAECEYVCLIEHNGRMAFAGAMDEFLDKEGDRAEKG